MGKLPTEMFSDHSNVSAILSLSMNNGFSVSGESLSKKVAKTVAYCVLFVVCVIGNTFIIWVIHKDKRLRSTTNILVANMAVSDLLVPLFSIQGEVFDIYSVYTKWPFNNHFGLVLCKLVHFVRDVSLVVSVYTCIFIAIDRYYAVFHPLKGGFSRTRLKYIIPGIWIFASIVGSPNLYKYRVLTKDHLMICVEDWSPAGIPHIRGLQIQIFLLFAILNGIPIPLITTLYVLIARKLGKCKGPGHLTNTAKEKREKQNKKVFKLSVVIISLLFVSWLFLDIVLFLGLLGKLDKLPTTTAHDLVFAAQFVAYSSCAYNFFVYLIFQDIYRENFKNLFSRCFCRCLKDTFIVSQSTEEEMSYL